MSYQIKCKFKISGYGAYLPDNKVDAKTLSEKMNVSEEWILKGTGVKKRYFSETETGAQMGAKAVLNAFKNSSVKMDEVTLLIAASATPDQPIPHNSALIHSELKLPKTVTPFDVDATCLSFSQALIVASSLIHSGLHKHVVVVSSERPSIGLNYNWPESAALFGDGAVAFILSHTEEEKGLVFADFETYNEGVHLAEIKAGGTTHHPKTMPSLDHEDFLFKMEGHKIYKMASLYLPTFVASSLQKNKINFDKIKMVIPHQASMLALSLMQTKLDIPKEKFYINVHEYGNLVAASVPMSLSDLLRDGKVQGGDFIMLLSTAAGLTLGNVGIVI